MWSCVLVSDFVHLLFRSGEGDEPEVDEGDDVADMGMDGGQEVDEDPS